MTRASSIALVAMLAACGGADAHSRAAGAADRFALGVRQVSWNPAGAAVGKVRSVADDGDVVVVLSEDGATIFRSGAAIGHDATALTRGMSISSIDGSSKWIVAVDKKGHLFYLRSLSTFDDVSERYGLTNAHVHDVALLGSGLVAFALDGQLAIAGGGAVTHYASSDFSAIAGGGSMLAGVGENEIDLVDVAAKNVSHFPLEGAAFAALDSKGHLFAATRRALYVAKPEGLALLFEADEPTIHGLVASGDSIWFADGSALGVIDGDRVAEVGGNLIAKDATLVASPSGDVWVVDGEALQRFARTDQRAKLSTVLSWSDGIQPIFARSCAGCHLPGGVSGTDLSTNDAWISERDEIRDRVVSQRSMPPPGHPLSDADRDAIRAWLDAAQR